MQDSRGVWHASNRLCEDEERNYITRDERNRERIEWLSNLDCTGCCGTATRIANGECIENECARGILNCGEAGACFGTSYGIFPDATAQVFCGPIHGQSICLTSSTTTTCFPPCIAVSLSLSSIFCLGVGIVRCLGFLHNTVKKKEDDVSSPSSRINTNESGYCAISDSTTTITEQPGRST